MKGEDWYFEKMFDAYERDEPDDLNSKDDGFEEPDDDVDWDTEIDCATDPQGLVSRDKRGY